MGPVVLVNLGKHLRLHNILSELPILDVGSCRECPNASRLSPQLVVLLYSPGCTHLVGPLMLGTPLALNQYKSPQSRHPWKVTPYVAALLTQEATTCSGQAWQGTLIYGTNNNVSRCVAKQQFNDRLVRASLSTSGRTLVTSVNARWP